MEIRSEVKDGELQAILYIDSGEFIRVLEEDAHGIKVPHSLMEKLRENAIDKLEDIVSPDEEETDVSEEAVSQEKQITDLKKRINALESEIMKLKGDIKETVIKSEVDNSVINMNRNCDLANRITRSRPRNPDGRIDVKNVQMDYDDITKAVNENNFWFFPNTPSQFDNTVMTQDYVSENKYIEGMRKKMGSLVLPIAGDFLLRGDSAKEIVESNCN